MHGNLGPKLRSMASAEIQRIRKLARRIRRDVKARRSGTADSHECIHMVKDGTLPTIIEVAEAAGFDGLSAKLERMHSRFERRIVTLHADVLSVLYPRQ